MNKTLLAVLWMACGLQFAYAQQDPLYTQYVVNPYIINPAYTGYNKDFSAWASYRLQWAGFDGAPETKSISGHVALADNRMGIGLIVLQDKIGIDNNTQVVATYGYHLLLDDKKISFGLRGGLSQYRVDYSDLKIDETDPGFQENISVANPVVGAGLLFSTDRLIIGFSIPNMLKHSISTNGVESVLYNQHLYAQAAYLVQLSPRIKIKPFTLARVVGQSPVNFDFGAMLTADDSYTVGAFSRRLYTYGLLAKINLGDALRVGYIFELPTNKSVGVNYTTHEFSVGIRMSVLRFHDLLSVTDF